MTLDMALPSLSADDGFHHSDNESDETGESTDNDLKLDSLVPAMDYLQQVKHAHTIRTRLWVHGGTSAFL